MKIELTELELLYILAMLDASKIEEDKAYAEFIRALETGLIDRLPRLPEISELTKKLVDLDTFAVYEKFLEVAKELNLVAIE
ncbi:hypothetical protein [Enterococcus faecium]|uniref:hypothetical protein n=1 Tax=Enterococcus faecium TaxID=1352 RepID=UPI0003302240|nr:hypothetical protein [Enterococcus faecium]EOH43291.1 hypothetical protein SSG_02371 [Enterococcus faecium EnGen0190]